MSATSIAHIWSNDELEYDVNKTANNRAVIRYLVTTSLASDDETTILTYVKNSTGTHYQSPHGKIPRKRVSISERLSDKLWKVEVEYAYDSTNRDQAQQEDEQPTNDNAYGFEISTETRKMVYSFGLKNKFPSTAPTPQAGIRDGEGIDTVMPVAHFTETHKLTECTVAYRKRVASLVGKINSGSFKGYSRGEVLFLGASGSKNGDESWNITYKFATAEEQSGLTIGSITGISKDPWDCIWVRSRDAQIPNVGLVRQAQFVYTEQVYEYADFGVLGI